MTNKNTETAEYDPMLEVRAMAASILVGLYDARRDARTHVLTEEDRAYLQAQAPSRVSGMQHADVCSLVQDEVRSMARAARCIMHRVSDCPTCRDV